MRGRIGACAFALLAAFAAHAQTAATAPYTWTENFSSGNLGQFSSYPPAQDAGYDPTLSPAPGNARMREIRPSRSGPVQFGFLRRLDLLASANGRLRFSYSIQRTRPEDRLEVGIAASNGRRYSASLAIVPGGWRIADIAMAQFVDAAGHRVPAGAGIEGVYLVAGLRDADANVTYRFLIRGLSLGAARTLSFELRQPRAVRIAHWPELFSVESFQAGRAIPLQAASPIALAKAECTAEDPEGRARGTWPLRRKSGVWSANVAADSQPGIEYLVLRGMGTDGRTISTRLRVLRVPSRIPPHPRLLFGGEDRARLAARIHDPRYAAIWRGLEQKAEAAWRGPDLTAASGIFALLDPAFLLPTLPAYFDIVNRAGPDIELNALDAWLTGNAAARLAAKSALLAVAHWNTWAPPWFRAHGQQTYYPAGLLAVQAALGYDLLYDSFTEDERELIRSSLLEYAIARPYREYVSDNRILTNTSNWIGHTVGGALVASAALWGDVPAPALALPVNGLLRKFEDHLAASYLADGSYGEGASYQEFDLQTTALALNALERVFGMDYWSRSHVADSLWYPISTLADPIGGSLDMGDSHPPSGAGIAPVVARSRNPVFQWYYDHFPHRSLADFLFADFSLPSRAPHPPGSREFADKGSVVFRTGWGPDDTILLFRVGPNFNHNHAGQGEFLLRAFGANLITEAGYSDYYKDPYYDSYFKQAIGHNTVLVDGDPESQEIADNATLRALDRYPRMKDVLLSPELDAVASGLHQVYRGRLRRFERRIVFLKPENLIFVYDDLAAAQPPSQFDWLLHLPNRGGVILSGATASYVGPKAGIAIQRLFPADGAVRLDGGHFPFAVFNPLAPPAAPPQPAILRFTAQSASGRARFLVALAPSRGRPAMRTGLQATENRDWLVVSRQGAQEERILFRKEPSRAVAADGPWSSDATMWMVRLEAPGGRIDLLAAQDATVARRSGEVLFSSTRPVSFAAEYRGGEIELTVNAAAPGRIRIAKPGGGVADIDVTAGAQQWNIH